MTRSSASMPTTVSRHMHAWLALACGVAYYYAFELNMHWFSDALEFSPGANWVFLPSGLRLLFVLVLSGTGAAGIVVGSLAVNYSLGDPEAHFFNLVTSVISGGAPFLARHLSINWLGLDTHLVNLRGQVLLKVSVLFALVNALMHQLWYCWIDRTENFMASAAAMAVGDWFGTVLVLAATSLVIRLFKRASPDAL